MRLNLKFSYDYKPLQTQAQSGFPSYTHLE